MARMLGVFASPTRATLLERLKDPEDSDSWEQFMTQYLPGMLQCARNFGLSEDEAKDIAQDVAVQFSKKIGGFVYQPEKGSFRAYLGRALRWRIGDMLRNRLPAGLGGEADASLILGEEALENLADPKTLEPDKAWEMQLRREIVKEACARVRRRVQPKHYQVYDLLSHHDHPPKRVAQLLDLNVGNVQVINLRIRGAISREAAKLLGAFQGE